MKANVDLNYEDANHKHAVTDIGTTQKYWYDSNGNQTTRILGSDTYILIYDAENRLIEVKKNSATQMKFTYDGDGKRVKSEAYTGGVVTETILFIGSHYEFNDTTNEVTKYYFAGASKVAMRKYIVPESVTLTYLFGDHLGSTSLSVDAVTGEAIETRYKPWGEVRYTTPTKTLPTRYTFTSQYSYMNDDATDLGSAGFGLLFYNARWMDPVIGRFIQADSIVPGGAQGLDRYAYTNNSPVMYIDPSGHCTVGGHWMPDDSSACTWNTNSNILKSSVVIIFGTHGKGQNTLGIARGASDGTGVVVGDTSTIVTAEHVYSNRPNNADTVFIMVNGTLVEYSLDDVNIATGPGDLATLTLPNPLPGSVVPAEVANNYHSKPGQPVVTIYSERVYENGLITGYTLHAANTVTNDPVVDDVNTPGVEYGNQLILLSPNQTVNDGDSGGGVFYNGKLIGVNSSIGSGLLVVAPLCFNWYLGPWFSSVC